MGYDRAVDLPGARCNLGFHFLGVFAGSKKIPAGTFVGIYSGELLLESVSHERGL
jgi:hypothetical protein